MLCYWDLSSLWYWLEEKEVAAPCTSLPAEGCLITSTVRVAGHLPLVTSHFATRNLAITPRRLCCVTVHHITYLCIVVVLTNYYIILIHKSINKVTSVLLRIIVKRLKRHKCINREFWLKFWLNLYNVFLIFSRESFVWFYKNCVIV